MSTERWNCCAWRRIRQSVVKGKTHGCASAPSGVRCSVASQQVSHGTRDLRHMSEKAWWVQLGRVLEEAELAVHANALQPSAFVNQDMDARICSSCSPVDQRCKSSHNSETSRCPNPQRNKKKSEECQEDVEKTRRKTRRVTS